MRANFCGKELAVFRDHAGNLGAVDDICPHRRMRLSTGKVEADRLVCPYHGWSYDRKGDGFSPGNPKMHPCVQAYDVIERYGAIWVKEKGTVATFPELGGPDFLQVCTLHYRINAPLELVADNFAEIEHTCATHIFLGHDIQGIAAVDSQMQVADTAIHIVNRGPQKRMPRFLEKLLGFNPGDLFVGEGQITFDPVCSKITNYWISPEQHKRPGEAQGTVVFNPVNDQQTDMMIFFFVSAELALYGRLLRPLATFLLDYESKLDKRMIEQIADKCIQVEGMQLGKFDRPLKPMRDRINRIYWGQESKIRQPELSLQHG
jgi:vanillate O-demethylase monooxygenase subunit